MRSCKIQPIKRIPERMITVVVFALLMFTTGCSGSLFDGLTTDKSITIQNSVFPSSIDIKSNTAVAITGTGNSDDKIWIAPAGITDVSQLVVGNTMTTAPGDASTLLSPNDQGEYRIYVVDSNGKLSPQSKAILTVDDTAPVFTLTGPDGIEVSTTEVSYTLDETLKSGTIKWTKTGGAPVDLGSPHVVNLTGAELNLGTHTDILLSNAPSLVNNVVYRIDFNGEDEAGNIAATVINTNVTYKNLPNVDSVSVTTLSDSEVGVVNLSITFDRTMDTTTNPSPAITGLTTDPYTVTGSAWSNSDKTWTGTFTFVDDSEELTGTINISGFKEVTGNIMLADPSNTIAVDTKNPTVAITSTASALTNDNPIPITITFNEDVNNFILGDLSVGNGTASNLVATTANRVWTADITPTTDGTVTVDINADVAMDNAGNNNSAATQLSRTYDGTAPTVIVTSTSSSPTNDNLIPVTITFNEDVNNFVLGDITVANGTAGNLVATTANRVWTADITPTTDGAVTVDINADVATDDAGNGNTAATQLSITYDGTKPTVSISVPSVYYAKDGDSVTYTITYTGADSVTLAAGDVTLNTTGGASCSKAVSGTGTATRTVTLTSCTGDGTVGITIESGTASDTAGNTADASSASTVFNVDNTNPVISSVSPSSSANINSTLVSYIFSEICDTGSITWTRTGGTADASSPHVKSLTGSELNAGAHNNITITNNPTLTDGSIYTITWACTDRVGLTATAIDSTSVTFTDSLLTIVGADTMDTDNDGKIDTYKIAFNKSVKDSTFPGYSANSLGSVTSEWLVAGYTNVRMIHGTAASSFATDTPDDSVIYLRYDESLTTCDASDQAGCDTGVKPDLTTTASPGLQDLATNTMAQVQSGDVTESDNAKPLLITAKSLSATEADVIFSEAMEQTTSETDTYYTIDNGVTVSAASRDGGNNKVIHLTTSTQTGGTTYTLTVNTDVKDLANLNIDGSANTTTFDGLVKPIVVSIVTASSTTLTITFNETVTAASAECDNLTACSVIYSNSSLPVKSAVSTAGATNNSATYTLTVNTMVEGQNYTTTVLENTVTSVASSEKMGTINNSATFIGDGNPGVNISTDTASGSNSCPSNGAKRVVVEYDQTVTTGVSTVGNYTISLCVTGDCANGSGSPNDAGAATVTNLSGNKYAIDFTDSFDTDDSQYRLTIQNVQDANGNAVASPTNLSFQCGNDTTAPVLIKAEVVSSNGSSSQIMLTFSESVDQVTANTSSSYKYDSESYGTNVSTAARQSNTSQVLVTFAPGLSEGGHQIRVQNVKDIASTPNTIIDDGVNNIQPIIVNAPDSLGDGSVFEDPFNDGTKAGYLVKYDGKLYIGADVNSAKLFETDYGLTTSQSILIDADGNAGNGTVADFYDYVSTNSGTIKGVDTLYAACIGGTSIPSMTGADCTGASGIEHMFIGSLNITGMYISFWDTTDVSTSTTTFTFTEGLNPDPGGSVAFRSTVLLVFKDYLWSHFGAEAGGGTRGGRICVNSNGCTADSLSYGQGIRQYPPNFTYVGNQGTVPNGSKSNIAGGSNYLNALNVLYEYDNDGSGSNESQLYMANGGIFKGTLGQVRSGHADGGIVRSKLAYSSKSSLPPYCDSASSCNTYWENVTPGSNSNISDWTNYVSIPYPQNSAVTGSANCGTGSVEMDCTEPYNIFIPAMKAIPYMKIAPNGDLYIIRNACSSQKVCVNGAADITGFGGCEFRTEKQVCPSGSEVTQLWMLPKNCGSDTACADAWVLVAEYGASGKTNMQGNNAIGANNSHITLLEFVGNYLYIGFDNSTDGANIWRADMSAVTTGNFPAENAFTMVNVTGLDGTTTNQKIFSHITINDSGTDWLILTTREGSSAMQIYRTANGQD